MDVVQAGRQGINEVGAREGVFGVTTVDGISGENRMVTQVLTAMTAIPAIAVDAAHPGDTHACPEWQLGGRAIHDLADNLMTGYEPRLERGQIAFDDMQVGAADSAGHDAK